MLYLEKEGTEYRGLEEIQDILRALNSEEERVFLVDEYTGLRFSSQSGTSLYFKGNIGNSYFTFFIDRKKEGPLRKEKFEVLRYKDCITKVDMHSNYDFKDIVLEFEVEEDFLLELPKVILDIQYLHNIKDLDHCFLDEDTFLIKKYIDFLPHRLEKNIAMFFLIKDDPEILRRLPCTEANCKMILDYLSYALEAITFKHFPAWFAEEGYDSFTEDEWVYMATQNPLVVCYIDKEDYDLESIVQRAELETDYIFSSLDYDDMSWDIFKALIGTNLPFKEFMRKCAPEGFNEKEFWDIIKQRAKDENIDLEVFILKDVDSFEWDLFTQERFLLSIAEHLGIKWDVSILRSDQHSMLDK